MIQDAGGTAVALRVDHTNETEVKALFRRMLRAHKRIDVVVDSVAGEDPLMKLYGYLWQAELKTADAIFRQGLTSRIITAKHAALAMMPAKRGLIVEVTENDMIGGGGNPMAQAVKLAQKVLPLLWAAELAPHGISVMAITPGFLRSESMLQHFGVTEDNWREAGKKDPNFLESESPLFVGRAIAALAADPHVQDRSGMLFSSWELGRDYGLSDYDGRRPDWGRFKIDFSVLPTEWIDLFRRGTNLEIKWLTTLAARTRKFKAKIPS
jgi:NAD(P)-dependent dehydrogenase (short-subunit alcohol dehydrogenase family)